MDNVNSPSHYNKQSVEVIEMMLRVYGPEAVINFCELNALKYRMRAGYKDDAKQDIDKALWYENKIEEIKINRYEH